MVRGAATVIAGNAYLAAHARPHNADVTVIPTAADLADYPTRAEDSAEPIIGWIGTRPNLMYLRPLSAPWRASERTARTCASRSSATAPSTRPAWH